MNENKSNLSDIWKKFKKNKMAVISLFLILLFIISAFLAPIIAPYDPALQNMSYDGIPQPPSFKHLFGTDNYGRDLFSRAIFGTRISLLVGFGAVSIYMIIGIILGAVSGYFGGIVDSLIMRMSDIMLSIPVFFFILALQVIFTPSVWNVILVIGFTNWAGPTRLMRAQALSLKESLFVEAAQSFGAKGKHIIFRHIIPNAMSPMIVTATLGVASAILMESTLSFLGLGVQEPSASWGNMLMRAQEYMTTAPWMAIFPGILIMLVVISFNFLGDGLRDAFDPKTN
ncbi:ABC transporter permease [bacterium]|nr:ABC transporter permease [bacterium]